MKYLFTISYNEWKRPTDYPIFHEYSLNTESHHDLDRTIESLQQKGLFILEDNGDILHIPFHQIRGILIQEKK